jgi:hypothetical protein
VIDESKSSLLLFVYPWKDIVGKKVSKWSIAELRAFYGMLNSIPLFMIRNGATHIYIDPSKAKIKNIIILFTLAMCLLNNIFLM